MNVFLLSLVLAFLLGSIPSGYLLGKLHGLDVRNLGSGNTGATNIARSIGNKAGIITLVVDLSKGVLAALLPLLMGVGQLKWNYLSETDMRSLYALFGFFAVVGHCYSPFLKFSGGKGVATAFGVLLVVDYVMSIAAGLVFYLSFRLTKIVSLSSLIASVSVVLITLSELSLAQSGLSKVFTLSICLLVFWRHKENIDRLIKGEEKKLKV